MKKFLLTTLPMLMLAATIALLAGCKDKETGDQHAGGAAEDATLPAGLIVESAPGAPTPIKDIQADPQAGEVVTVRAVVGKYQDKKPIVEGYAVFSVIDSSVENKCLTEDDHCPTPWDYCCAPGEIKSHTATIRILDETGKELKVNLPNAGKIAPLATLVIQGKVAEGSGDGNLIIDANKIFIAQTADETMKSGG